MEALRVSKLEEGQQWGKNTSSKDKVHWGRRPPFIGVKKSNRYAHSPHRAVLPLVLTVLPLGVAILPLRVAVLMLASGTKKITSVPTIAGLMTSFWSGAEVATEVGAVVLLQVVVPLPRAVVKNYFRSYPR